MGSNTKKGCLNYSDNKPSGVPVKCPKCGKRWSHYCRPPGVVCPDCGSDKVYWAVSVRI